MSESPSSPGVPAAAPGSVTAGDQPPAARSTRQKRAVEAVIDGAEEFLSARDLHDQLRERGESVGLATVYRTLQALADAGEVDVLKNDAGESSYRRCSRAHHHHLVCRVCGRTVEIEGPTVERWAAEVAREHGYTDVSHTIELFGVCSACHPAS